LFTVKHFKTEKRPGNFLEKNSQPGWMVLLDDSNHHQANQR
jgi:hypothetical protein